MTEPLRGARVLWVELGEDRVAARSDCGWRWEAQLGAAWAPRLLALAGGEAARPAEENEVTGELLGELLFGPRGARNPLHEHLSALLHDAEPSAPVSVRLSVPTAAAEVLPWELARLGDAVWLGADPRTTLARVVPPQADAPPSREPQLPLTLLQWSGEAAGDGDAAFLRELGRYFTRELLEGAYRESSREALDRAPPGDGVEPDLISASAHSGAPIRGAPVVEVAGASGERVYPRTAPELLQILGVPRVALLLWSCRALEREEGAQASMAEALVTLGVPAVFGYRGITRRAEVPPVLLLFLRQLARGGSVASAAQSVRHRLQSQAKPGLPFLEAWYRWVVVERADVPSRSSMPVAPLGRAGDAELFEAMLALLIEGALEKVCDEADLLARLRAVKQRGAAGARL